MMLQFSKYNIFSKIKDSDDYFILNLLTKNADILTPGKAKEIENKKYTETDEYIEKGYLTEPVKEGELYRNAYLDFLDEREKSEIQIFFVPTYDCNFSCSYCYQSDYNVESNDLNKEMIDAFYSYIDDKFKNRNKYITIFGGEPLLQGDRARKNFLYLLDKSKENNLGTAIVTNGYHLIDYLDDLKNYKIKEIQVTLDGLEEVHDSRRPHKNGNATFSRIVDGIDEAIKNNITINLRFVADKDNIDELPKLSRFAIEKGWTKSDFFKTQIGRNYELHYCQKGNDRLYSRVELYSDLYNMIKKYSEITEFHKSSFSISKFLYENGELPQPLFDSCPGCKTEWAFDYTGKIYSCTATVGKPGEALGTFFPNVTLNQKLVDEWEERDVTTIPECKDCNLQLACGGGCASVAKNKNGTLLSPDCRPVKELLEMGISYYFDKGE